MVINTNIASLRATRLLGETATRLQRSLSHLSSGSKITSPEEDAAGLGVSAKLNSQNIRNSAATSNLENAISLVQTQDGYLQQVQKALDRMGELSILAQDVTKSDADRANYDAEYQTLKAHIEEAFGKDFNGVPLFGGGEVTNTSQAVAGTGEQSNVISTGGNSGTVSITFNTFASADSFRVYYPPRSSGGSRIADSGAVAGAGSLSVSFGEGESSQIEIVVNEGNNTGSTWTYNVDITAQNNPHKFVTTDGSGARFSLSNIRTISASGSVATSDAAAGALTGIKTAIQGVAQRRAQVGANLTRLRSHVEELGILTQNLDTARSRITDVDVASESTQFARNSILNQSGTVLVAQANLLPNLALRLLGA